MSSLRLSNNVTVSGVFEKLAKAGESCKYISMEGSSRSTKTYSILQYIISRCLSSNKPLRIGIIRARLTWLKATLLEDFKDILRDQFGAWKETNFNKSEMVYWLNGCQIRFIGLDSEAGKMKAHGFKSDMLFLNECTELDYEPVKQLLQRCTYKGPVIFDFNPNCGEEFWLFKKVIPLGNSITIHSTYKDNPFLDDETVKYIESFEPTPENIELGIADETHWKIYGLGVRAIVKGLVYPEFKIIPSLPKDFDDRCKGLDFGMTHPTAFVHVAMLNGELYFDEQIYKPGLTSIINPAFPEQPSIEANFQRLNVTKRIKIWADQARPEMIKDLYNCGYNIEACQKGSGSVKAGIGIVRRYRLNVTERSMNMIKEFRNYKWKVDKNGKETEEVVKRFDDCMDAARYAVVGQFSDFATRSAKYDCSTKMQTGAEKYGY